MPKFTLPSLHFWMTWLGVIPPVKHKLLYVDTGFITPFTYYVLWLIICLGFFKHSPGFDFPLWKNIFIHGHTNFLPCCLSHLISYQSLLLSFYCSSNSLYALLDTCQGHLIVFAHAAFTPYMLLPRSTYDMFLISLITLPVPFPLRGLLWPSHIEPQFHHCPLHWAFFFLYNIYHKLM